MSTPRTDEEIALEPTGDVDIEVIARARYQGFELRLVEEFMVWVDDACEWLDVPSAGVFRGPEGYRSFDHAWIRAFPDMRWEVINVVTGGDLVATEFIARGTHLGPLGASGQTIDATAERIELRCVEVLQIHGAQIVRARCYYDVLSMLHQLGVSP
jgi:predicted ester cyclase